MKFTKKLYEGATLYGNNMYVNDIDVLPDATEFKFLGEAPYTGIKYYYLRNINKSFRMSEESILTKTSAAFR